MLSCGLFYSYLGMQDVPINSEYKEAPLSDLGAVRRKPITISF